MTLYDLTGTILVIGATTIVLGSMLFALILVAL